MAKYVLNVDEIINHETTNHIVKDAAKLLKEKQYFSPEEYFRNLSPDNQTELILMLDKNLYSEDSIILSLILYVAEGNDSMFDNDDHEFISKLIKSVYNMLLATSVNRFYPKKFKTLFENFTFINLSEHDPNGSTFVEEIPQEK